MIIIAEPYLRFSTSIARSALQRAAENVLENVQPLVLSSYTEQGREFDIRIFVRVEVGSTKVWVTVSAAASVLIGYGSIRQSIDYLVKDAKTVAGVVAGHAGGSLGLPNATPSYQQRRLGLPGQLQRLFREVQRHELDADAATARAIQLIYESNPIDLVDSAPGLSEALSREFRDAARKRPRRSGSGRPPKDEPAKLPSPDVALPPRQRSGVVVERDEKTGLLKVSTY